MRTRLIAAALLATYTAVLIRVLVFKNLAFHVGRLRFRIAAHPGETNLVPLRTIGSYLRGEHGALISKVNLIGNIAFFIPIGLLVPLVFPGLRRPAAVAVAVAIGLTFEGLEAAFRVGAFDVDDLILNGLGVLIGYAAFTLIARRPAGQAGT